MNAEKFSLHDFYLLLIMDEIKFLGELRWSEIKVLSCKIVCQSTDWAKMNTAQLNLYPVGVSSRKI